jgi:hypothetical protein
MADDSGTFGAFDRATVLMFAVVEIGLATGGQLRLLDGSGSVSFGGRTFVGLDPDYGVLANLEAITDGMGDEAPALRIGLNPPTADAAATLAGQQMQGQGVLVWIGVLDPVLGAVVDTPALVFAGEVDQGILAVGMGSRSITLECVSVWERLFEDLEGVRLTNAFHQNAWPGELGLEFVTDVKRQLPWGSDNPRPAVISDAIYVRPNQ